MYTSKWLYMIAGGGISLSFLSYFHSGKKNAYTFWNAEFGSNAPGTKWNYNWDKRDPSSLAQLDQKNETSKVNINQEEIQKNTPTASRNLIFVRHGQYDKSDLRESMRTLTKLGSEQAEIVGQRLKSLNYKFDRIICSTMTRALDTSTIVQKYFPGVPVEKSDMLREVYPMKDGEWKPSATLYEDEARMEAAFRKYFKRADSSQMKNSYELFVCHGNLIRYFVCRAMQLPPEAWGRFQLFHCCITWICIRPDGRVIVNSVGDTGHLPPDKLTTNKMMF